MVNFPKTDVALIHAARAAIAERYRPDCTQWAVLRLRSGVVVTGFISTRMWDGSRFAPRLLRSAGPSQKLVLPISKRSWPSTTTVPVKLMWFPPCGMCREIISDYSEAYVIVPGDDGKCSETAHSSLLPGKYRRGTR